MIDYRYRVVAVPPNERELRLHAIAAYEVTHFNTGNVTRVFAIAPAVQEIGYTATYVCRDCAAMNTCPHAEAVARFPVPPTPTGAA